MFVKGVAKRGRSSLRHVKRKGDPCSRRGCQGELQKRVSVIVIGVLFIVLAMLCRRSETALRVRPPAPSVPPPDSRTAFPPTTNSLVPSRVGGKAKARNTTCERVARLRSFARRSKVQTPPTPTRTKQLETLSLLASMLRRGRLFNASIVLRTNTAVPSSSDRKLPAKKGYAFDNRSPDILCLRG